MKTGRLPRRLEMSEISDLGLDRLRFFRPEEMAAEIRQDGLQVLGTGGFAVTVAHPWDRGLVIRVSAYNDGWIGYALSAQGEEHAPEIEALGCHDMRWISVVERLQPIPEDMWDVGRRLGEALQAPGGLDSPGLQGLFRSWPDLKSFAEIFLPEADDLDGRNLMMRGRTLVVNDPFSEMDFDLEARLMQEWAVLPEPADDLEDMEP